MKHYVSKFVIDALIVKFSEKKRNKTKKQKKRPKQILICWSKNPNQVTNFNIDWSTYGMITGRAGEKGNMGAMVPLKFALLSVFINILI